MPARPGNTRGVKVFTKNRGYLNLLTVLFILINYSSFCQQQPEKLANNKVDSFYQLKYKGLLGKIAQTIVVDSTDDGSGDQQRLDRKFQRHRNKIIRNIIVKRLPFGTPIQDTSKSFTSVLTDMANYLHYDTREKIVRNNLFFRKNEKLSPYLMGDNERHLRDLVFLGDASISVRTIAGTRDSVDILILTKDVLSVGGKFDMSALDDFQVNAREDNFLGMGDRLEGKLLFDAERRQNMGFGVEYIRRNINGSFMDGTIGWQNYFPSILGGLKQDNIFYTRLLKPLVHPYMKWTYGLDASLHYSKHQYLSDSTYKMDHHYGFYNVDAWGGIVFDPYFSATRPKDERLRTYLGLRVISQKFNYVPGKFIDQYFFRYADQQGILASLSMFSQTYYKTRYVYGLGRSEDVPEGLDVSVTTGYVNKEKRQRQYLGMGLQLSYFSKYDNYYNYTVRLGGYKKKNSFEDIDLLGNLEFFSNLRRLGKWKQRSFITIGVAKQFSPLLNEPLFLSSEYGLREFTNDSLFGGNFRAVIKAESVFYSDWSLIGFRFAPFIFANGSYLDGPMPERWHKKFFPSVGGGLRTRNESLIFGTVELRGFYFPDRNFYNERVRVEVSTNLRFKYNMERLKRPEFISFN